MDVTLVVMAAGMGARFGGLKQLTPIGQSGETVAEFSVYDALRAGFNRAVFVIKPEMERDFRERVLARFERHIRCDLVFQQLDDLPQGAPALPTERGPKPLGTAHAVWSCRRAVHEPFLVINADDFYGASAFGQVRAFLLSHPDTVVPHPCCMAAYRLKDTVSEHGSVSRGVCEIDNQGNLRAVVERTRIEGVKGQNNMFFAQEGEKTIPLSGDMPVSLNTWGFHPSVFVALEEALRAFLAQPAQALIKGECYLPSVVESMLENNRAYVRALPARDRWIGITYAEDLEPARRLIRNLVDEGKYPADLWAQEIHMMEGESV